MTISLCMIVKNEQDVITRCLESVKNVMDEIVIVDTGSVDDTKELCRLYTEKIFDFEWIDDFAAARNFSFSNASMEYVMWMDADDVLLEEDRKKLTELKRTMPSDVNTVMMKYNIGFDAIGNLTMSYYRERIVRRQLGGMWHEPVHEYHDCIEKVIYTDICITHRKEHASPSNRNIRIYENQIAHGRELSPRGQYYYARELYYHGRYHEAIQYFTLFLDGNMGWVEDNIGACHLLSECFHLIGDSSGAMKSAVKSLEYDLPRVENCCQIALIYLENKEYKKAIFWYKLAMSLPMPERELGFILHDYYGYLPCIQLCVCYDRLGEIAEAVRFNEMAAEYKPGDAAVEYNREYFKRLQK